ncbi:MAG TPA: neocarzinostatin apoprotein domain-containing protein [Acidimicrobiales bacterium]|jgi:hypothetical protein
MFGRRGVAAALAVAALVGGMAAPAGAAARDPSITVEPDTNLVDNQRVVVHGEGWRPNTFLVIAQCDARATSFAGCEDGIGVFEPTSEWSVPFEVDRAIDTEAFGRVDCADAAGRCVIGVLARPGRVLETAPLHFDPEGPPADPPLTIEVDVAPTARVRTDARGARIDVTVTCDPGEHAFVDVQLAQDRGEEDAVGFGGVFLRRCRGTQVLTIDLRAFEGTFVPGDAFVTATAFGFRTNGDQEISDFEFAEVTLVG